jgi:hypothetical protein
MIPHKRASYAPTPAEQGAAPDRLQLRLSLVPRYSLRFRRRVSLVVISLRAAWSRAVVKYKPNATDNDTKN